MLEVRYLYVGFFMIKTVLDRCQPWRYINAACRLCLEACPIDGCVSFAENTVSVNNGLCTGCGVCTAACPSGALVLEGLSDEELFSRLKTEAGDKELFLLCSLGPGKNVPGSLNSTAIRVPCLAVLKESHLISLIVSGVKKIGLDCSGCVECSVKSGGKTILKAVSEARALLARLDREDSVEVTDRPKGEGGNGAGVFKKRGPVKDVTPGVDFSRRELFTLFKEKAVKTASEKVLGKNGEKAAVAAEPEAPAGRRALLLESLRRASIPAGLKLNEGEFPVRTLGIRDGCVMCGRCEAFCPTGALERTEDGGETRIDFRTDKCALCFQCAEFCPAGALYYEQATDLKTFLDGQAVTLMRKKRVKCHECGKEFMPEVEKEGCPSCGKKKRLDNRILSILFGDDTGKPENKSGAEEA